MRAIEHPSVWVSLPQRHQPGPGPRPHDGRCWRTTGRRAHRASGLENVGARYVGGAKQSVEIGDRVAGCPWHGNGVAPAEVGRVQNGSRAIIGADSREGGGPGHDRRRIRYIGCPDVSIVSYPDSRITVGVPLPWHSRYIFRPPPMSTRPAKSPRAAVAHGEAGDGDCHARPEAGASDIKVSARIGEISHRSPALRVVPWS